MSQEIKIKVGSAPWVKIKTPAPKDFTIERYNLTKSGRLAAGNMVMDLISKKRKFLFRYPAITGKELNVILGLIDTNAMFFQVSYYENGVNKVATCYAGHVPSQTHRTDGNWVWKEVNFDLIER